MATEYHGLPWRCYGTGTRRHAAMAIALLQYHGNGYFRPWQTVPGLDLQIANAPPWDYLAMFWARRHGPTAARGGRP